MDKASGCGLEDCRFESYWAYMNLHTLVNKIPRIGIEYQKKLKRLGIKTVRDLLWHFPYRYQDFSILTPISEVKIGETVCIQAEIVEIKIRQTWKKRMFLTTALVKDKTGSIKVVWFNQPYLINTLQAGDGVYLAGKTSQGPKGMYLSSPSYEKISSRKSDKSKLVHTGRIVPVYPETEGLSSRWLRFILKPLLTRFQGEIQDYLPEKIRKEHKLLNIEKALWQIHFPDSMKLAQEARERFSFEELFILSLMILREKMKLMTEKSISIPVDIEVIKEFVDSLPFKLTNAQKKCSWRILKDLERTRPMNRLLEGDVGSGKTVVAVMAALNVSLAGFQTGFMAPTEILANQHFQEISKLLKGFNLKIALLTGKESKLKTKKITRKKLLEKIEQGKIDILIGTHALIQKSVKFGKLALVILDEQHRFGVEQRARLCQGSNGQVKLIPHLLSMTATPIPRTLALTVYGDLDLSLIDEMPKGRKKVITKIVKPKERKETYQFIREQIKNKKQVFVICPRIESSNDGTINSWTDTKTIKQEYKKLSEEIFPKFKIDMLHGRMKPDEKEKIMKKFKKGKTDILVSTSVVEVGIDVPNATVMMIEGAEKFGLAQLHQFRGRVGRGNYQSYCFLLTSSSSPKTNKRLRALKSCENGFELAEKDLEIRGPGELLGSRQWGIPDLSMASLKDVFLVEKTRNTAKELLNKDPQLKKHPLLQKRLKLFRQRIHLE